MPDEPKQVFSIRAVTLAQPVDGGRTIQVQLTNGEFEEIALMIPTGLVRELVAHLGVASVVAEEMLHPEP